MRDDPDTGREGARGEDGFVQVLERVGPFHLEWAHCTGEDHRDRGVAQMLVQELTGLAQGVGAVQDDDARAVRRVVEKLDRTQDPPTVGVRHLQRVLLHQLQGIDVRILEPEQPEHLLHDRGSVGERARLLVVRFLDGPAGRNERDLSHLRKIIPGFRRCQVIEEEVVRVPMMSLKDAYDQARTLHDQGFYRSALRSAEILHKQSPFHPPVVALYVSCLIRVQRNEQAVRIAKRALRNITNKPHRAMILTSMSDGMTQSGELDEAIELMRTEFDAQPENLALASSLGHLLMLRGDLTEAVEFVESLRERNIESLSLAAIFGRALLRTDRCDEAILYINELFERFPETGPSSKQQAYNVLGHLLDRAKRYDEAMEAFHRCNELLNPGFDAARLDRTIECVQRCWTADRFARVSSRPQAAGPRPVFIVGMPRSGTTLTEQIIDAHPRAYGAGELGTIIDLFRESGLDPDNPYNTAPDQYDPEQLSKAASEYRAYIRELAGERDVDVIVDKAPLNCLSLGFIALTFPDAKIIHCHRDPRDNCLSCYFQLLNAGHSYSFDLHSCGVYYRYYRKMMKHYRELLHGPEVQMPIFENDYEGMVAGQEQRTRDILDYIGLPFDPACLNFHSSGRVAVTLSNDQVRQPIYTSSTKRYERYAAHLGPLIEGLGDVLAGEE